MRLLITLATLVTSLWAADNSLGTWKRNIEKSKSNPPSTNPVTTLSMVREAAGDGVKVSNTGVRKDGTPANWGYTAQYDGTEAAVTGNPLFDSISVKKIDDNTFATTARQKDGKYKTTGRAVVSKDKKTYTLTTKGTNADGQPYTQTLVYEKQ